MRLKNLIATLLSIVMIVSMAPFSVYADQGCDYLDENGELQNTGNIPVTIIDSTNLLTAWTEGWYLVQGLVEMVGPVTVTGEVHLILQDNSSFTVIVPSTQRNAAISVTANNSFTVYGQSIGEEQGLLVARGGRSSAAIGGDDGSSVGRLTFNGGSIDTKGDYYGAGIGGGNRSAGGNIEINGGCVRSQGGSLGGAGIGGGGLQSSAPVITINGGDIHVGGSGSGAGIGGGISRSGGLITINGGDIHLNASSHGAGIGGGSGGSGGTITINGGSISEQKTSSAWAATVGGGSKGSGGIITINGGTLNAWSNYGAAIGGGDEGGAGEITINGGDIRANGNFGAAIGSGRQGVGGTVTLSGGKVEAKGWHGIGAGEIGFGVNVQVQPKADTWIELWETEEHLGQPSRYLFPDGIPYEGKSPYIFYESTPIPMKLYVPTNIVWDKSVLGKAKWDPVDYASGYKVRLYKDGLLLDDNIGSAEPALDLRAFMLSAGEGEYAIQVAAIDVGNPNIEDSGFSELGLILCNSSTPYLNEEGLLEYTGDTPLLALRQESFSDQLSTGWYLVRGEITKNKPLTIEGDVHLILEDKSSLSITVLRTMRAPAVEIGPMSTLTIYSQSTAGEEGRLEATGGEYCAGIGSSYGNNGGVLTINGGVLSAISTNSWGAGIGGGWRNSLNCIFINGGTINAQGGSSGPGIGDGNGASVGNIIINGGNVNARGNGSGAGIGGGYGSPGGIITFNGGVIFAQGGILSPGIGYNDGSEGQIFINGGKIDAHGGSAGAGIGGGYSECNGGVAKIAGGTITATGFRGVGAGQGGGEFQVSIEPSEDMLIGLWEEDLLNNPPFKTVQYTQEFLYESSSSYFHSKTVSALGYEIIFEVNGGSAVPSQTVDHWGYVQEPEAPVKEGYLFRGWYTDEPLIEAYDFTTPVTGPLTLYARWVKEHTLTYLAGENGHLEGELIQKVEDGHDGTEVIAIPDMGYHFDRWSDGITTASRTDTGVMADLTVTALFAINHYPVTFEVDGGSTIPTQTVNHGGLVTTPDDPTKDDYLFQGWYSDEYRTARYNFTTPVTGPLTLYAKWTINQPDFLDVPKSEWYYPYVMYMANRGIVGGFGSTGEFRPDNNVIREHAAKMICLSADLPLGGTVTTFKDHQAISPVLIPHIRALMTKGAIGGFPDNTFRPQNNIERSHACKMVAKAFDLRAGGLAVHLIDLPANQELGDAIMVLASNGIVGGYGSTGEFRPDNEISRAELSKILCVTMAVSAVQRAESEGSLEAIQAAQAILDALPYGHIPETIDGLQSRLDALR